LTSTTIYNLNYNTTYSIYVKSLSNGYLSSETNVISLTTSALNTPTLTDSSYNQTPAGVNFGFSTGSSGCTTSSYSYNLYYSTNGTYAFVNISSSSYTYTPLSYNKNYTFYLKYVASNGDLSAASSNINVDTYIYPVTGLTATAISSSSVYLSWSAPSSTTFCTGYDVSYNTGTQTSSTTNATISSGLTSGTTYTFYVYANYNGTLSTDASINFTMPYGYTISANGFNTILSTYQTSSTITDAHDTSGVLVFTDTSSSADMSLNFTFYDGSLNYLIVCGGGGGGGGGGGSSSYDVYADFSGLGGGGGGGNSVNGTLLSNGNYVVTVGSGGSGGSGGTSGSGSSDATGGSQGGTGGLSSLVSSSLGVTISESGGGGGGGGGTASGFPPGGNSGAAGTSTNGGDGGRGE
jgi:hypothetical protein